MTAFPTSATLDPEILCVQCGLSAGEQDLAGCTRDTETSHDFRSVDSRPFATWTYEAIFARMQRAAIKAASAAATAAHMAHCREAGTGSYVHRLYLQKMQKRAALARALSVELWLRSHGADGPAVELDGTTSVLADYQNRSQ